LPDEDKLKWAFKLYDMDNNGVIDIKEMAAIIETLDCIEGVKPGCSIVPKL
jgi:Ca2+-binding EF-hand superfamily protein